MAYGIWDVGIWNMVYAMCYVAYSMCHTAYGSLAHGPGSNILSHLLIRESTVCTIWAIERLRAFQVWASASRYDLKWSCGLHTVHVTCHLSRANATDWQLKVRCPGKRRLVNIDALSHLPEQSALVWLCLRRDVKHTNLCGTMNAWQCLLWCAYSL